MDKKKREKLYKLIREKLSEIPTWWLLNGIGALAVLLYLNILPNSFIYDDWQQIVENPFLRRADALSQIFSTGVWDFTGVTGATNFYRPIMHAAFLFVFRTFGLNAGAYHLLSILLHLAVTLMVYAVIAKISGDRAVAAVAALLFAAQPVHTEAVDWIAAYPELFCALFSLLTIWIYLHARRAEGKRQIALSVLMGVLLLLALLSKETAIVIPVLIAAYELFLKRAKGQWIAFAAMAGGLAAYLAARIHGLGSLLPASTRVLPANEHLWTAAALFARYLAVQIFPLHLHAFYYLPLSHGPSERVVITGLASLGAMLALGWWLYHQRRPESLAIPLYLLPLAPAFLIPQASVGLLMSERYVYLASAGFCWLVAAAIVAIGRRGGYAPASPGLRPGRVPDQAGMAWGVAAALVLAVVAAYSTRTITRNEIWGDEVAFYQDAITSFPGFSRAYLNLGEALLRRDRLEEALAPTEHAAKLEPTLPDPRINLGLIYRRLGNNEAAIDQFRTAAMLAKQQGNAYVASRAFADLGVTYRAAGQLDEAIAASHLALEADPKFAAAHNNMGYALLLQGNVADAIEHFNKAIELDPALDLAYSNLGLAYSQQRQFEPAQTALEQALRLNPDNAETHARAGEVYLARGDLDRGLREFRQALQLDPNNERARSAGKTQEQKQ